MISWESPSMCTFDSPVMRANHGRRKWYLGWPRAISVYLTTSPPPYHPSHRMAPTTGGGPSDADTTAAGNVTANVSSKATEARIRLNVEIMVDVSSKCELVQRN